MACCRRSGRSADRGPGCCPARPRTAPTSAIARTLVLWRGLQGLGCDRRSSRVELHTTEWRSASAPAEGELRYGRNMKDQTGKAPRVAVQKSASLLAGSPTCGLLNQSHTRFNKLLVPFDSEVR